MNVFSILVAILVLGVMVFVHEMGHYLSGRLFKLRIVEFAMGFGPKIVKWTRKGILYSWRIFPIGGFVNFLGEDEDHDDPQAMNNQPVYKRFFTILAGPVFNIVFALLLAVTVFGIFGQDAPQIESVMPGSPAEQAGLQAGDAIVQVDGRELVFANEVSDRIAQSGDEVELTVLRNGEKVTVTTGFFFDETQQRSLIGINFERTFVKVRMGFFETIGFAFKWLYEIMKMMFVFLGTLIFRGQGAGDVTGPVGTIGIIGMTVQQSGVEVLLRLGALLSINLGVVNLLPFPALDGSKLVFLIIEGIRRKPINRKVEGMVHMVGLVILFGLMILLTISDIGRLGTLLS